MFLIYVKKKKKGCILKYFVILSVTCVISVLSLILYHKNVKEKDNVKSNH